MHRRTAAEKQMKAEFQSIYEADRRIHKENKRRKRLGLKLIPLELTSFPSIE
jgi:hypothetical protein